MKTCSRCQQELPREMFYRERKAPDGLYRWCKPCRKAYLAEKADHVRERHSRYMKRVGYTPERAKRQRLARYGLTAQEFDAMLERQGSLCAICAKSVPLVIDHDHATGQVRGLLCNKCNVALGMFEDSPEALRAALVYLARPSCNAETETNR